MFVLFSRFLLSRYSIRSRLLGDNLITESTQTEVCRLNEAGYSNHTGRTIMKSLQEVDTTPAGGRMTDDRRALAGAAIDGSTKVVRGASY